MRAEFDMSQSLLEESIRIKRELAKEKPNLYLGAVADSLNYLADIYLHKDEFVMAESAIKEALKIYTKLSKCDPQLYNLSVVETLEKYVNYYIVIGDQKNALEILKISIHTLSKFEKLDNCNVPKNKLSSLKNRYEFVSSRFESIKFLQNLTSGPFKIVYKK